MGEGSCRRGEGLAILKDENNGDRDEPLLNRKEIAKLLRVSLVTLTDWMKRGLPCHKQRGRVYFLKSEVMAFIKANHVGAYYINKRLIAV